jgi:hypothetical protein
VLQSLTLWREISSDMFKLWYLAEQDMLRQGASYRLCDTGQGLNRVQVRLSIGLVWIVMRAWSAASLLLTGTDCVQVRCC